VIAIAIHGRFKLRIADRWRAGGESKQDFCMAHSAFRYPRECGVFKPGPNDEQCYIPFNNLKEATMILIRKHWKYIPVVSLAMLLSGCSE
jgi:hypothetical protein